MKGIQVCSNESPRPFPRGDNYKISENTLTNLKKISSPEPLNQFWHKASLGEDSNEKTISYHKVYIFFSFLCQRYDIIICVYWFELFSQVSNVAHGPLVDNWMVFICKTLTQHKATMLCTKFDWNWPNVYFLTITPWKGHSSLFEQIPKMLCAKFNEIGPVVHEKLMKIWKVYSRQTDGQTDSRRKMSSRSE